MSRSLGERWSRSLQNQNNLQQLKNKKKVLEFEENAVDGVINGHTPWGRASTMRTDTFGFRTVTPAAALPAFPEGAE